MGVLLLASWPNALFDLCGIVCGHFRMPFWQFFGATLIGKGIIKVFASTNDTVFLIRSSSSVHVRIRFAKSSQQLATPVNSSASPLIFPLIDKTVIKMAAGTWSCMHLWKLLHLHQSLQIFPAFAVALLSAHDASKKSCAHSRIQEDLLCNICNCRHLVAGLVPDMCIRTSHFWLPESRQTCRFYNVWS